MFLDDFDLRIIVALGLRLVATERVPADDDAFADYVHALAARATFALQTQGVRSEPVFPGRREERSVFVADLWRADEHVGTAFTSLIRGRLPNINVAPPIAPAASR